MGVGQFYYTLLDTDDRNTIIQIVMSTKVEDIKCMVISKELIKNAFHNYVYLKLFNSLLKLIHTLRVTLKVFFSISEEFLHIKCCTVNHA